MRYLIVKCSFTFMEGKNSKLLPTQLRGFKELIKLLEDGVDELENQHPDYYTREM